MRAQSICPHKSTSGAIFDTRREVVPPARFLNVVEHIRNLFSTNRQLRANVRSLCSHGVPGAVWRAAVASLVNCGFLRLTDDDRVMRADADVEPPSRRTA